MVTHTHRDSNICIGNIVFAFGRLYVVRLESNSAITRGCIAERVWKGDSLGMNPFHIPVLRLYTMCKFRMLFSSASFFSPPPSSLPPPSSTFFLDTSVKRKFYGHDVVLNLIFPPMAHLHRCALLLPAKRLPAAAAVAGKFLRTSPIVLSGSTKYSRALQIR